MFGLLVMMIGEVAAEKEGEDRAKTRSCELGTIEGELQDEKRKRKREARK